MLYTLHIIANPCYCLPRSWRSKKDIFSQRGISWSERTESPFKLCSLSVSQAVSPALLRRGTQRLPNCICHKSLTFQEKKKKKTYSHPQPIPTVFVPASAAQWCTEVQTPCAVAPGLTFWFGFCRPKWCLESHIVRANAQFLSTYPSESQCPLRPYPSAPRIWTAIRPPTTLCPWSLSLGEPLFSAHHGTQ